MLKMFQQCLQRIWQYMCRTTEDSEPQFLLIGVLLLLPTCLFYFINQYSGETLVYESFYVRFIASLLGILLMVRKFWPRWLIRFSPIVWYMTLLYSIPFFASFMILKNGDSTIWKVNGLQGLVVLAIFVTDWMPYLIISVLGMVLGWMVYCLTTVDIQIPHDMSTIFCAYVISVTYCLIFLRSKESVRKTKFEIQKRISQEIAHDIRSPLTVLRMATEDLSALAESKRIMIRNSTIRVSDIANNLLSNLEEMGTGHVEKRAPELLSTTLDRMLSEKRTQYSNQKIEFELAIPNALMTLFVNVQPIEFKRVLSNLINNSVEAFKKQEGRVTLTLRQENNLVKIDVADNGRGIPPKLLRKIFEQGQSFGKKGGHGLGLSHAQRTINLWGGKITIVSEMNVGTTITVGLPIEKEPPKWFASEINVPENATIVVIDDDDFIHLVWKERFNDSLAKGLVNLISFRSLDKFTEWFQQNKKSSYFLLMDYEFKNAKATGPETLKKLQVSPTQALLVTSYFEEPHIRYECVQQGLKIVPKNISSVIPVKIIGAVLTTPAPEKLSQSLVAESKQVDLVLIDDDEEVIEAWMNKAVLKKKKMVGFSSIEAFLKEAEQYDRKTKIYVDSDLGNGVKGEIASENIAKLGFKQIHLCTGYSYNPEKFAKYPWIIKVQGKEPPF